MLKVCVNNKESENIGVYEKVQVDNSPYILDSQQKSH